MSSNKTCGVEWGRHGVVLSHEEDKVELTVVVLEVRSTSRGSPASYGLCQ